MAYGTDAAFGLLPIRMFSGAPFDQSSGLICTIASGYNVNLIPGDPVTFSGTGGTAGPGIVRAAAGAPFIGVFGGIIEYQPTNDPLHTTNPSWIASSTVKTGTQVKCIVYTDPMTVFAIQVGAGTTVILPEDLGFNANVVIAEGSVETNTSGVYLSQATIANNANLNLKIIGLYDHFGNGFTDVTYPVVEVLINNHVFGHGTGTAGI